MNPGKEDIALVKKRFAVMQKNFVIRFAELTDRLRAEKDPAVRQKMATEASSQMAEEAQNLALALYRHIVYGEAPPEE